MWTDRRLTRRVAVIAGVLPDSPSEGWDWAGRYGIAPVGSGPRPTCLRRMSCSPVRGGFTIAK
ncbi:hypothetical protein GCM10027073_73740 [Streptomyces chlorus]